MILKLVFSFVTTMSLVIPTSATSATSATTGITRGAGESRERPHRVGVLPVLLQRASDALLTARSVESETIPPLPDAPTPRGLTYNRDVRTIVVRHGESWEFYERRTDATGAPLDETVMTPTGVCVRDARLRPPAWRCAPAQRSSSAAPIGLDGDAQTVWRSVGERTLYGASCRGYEAALDSPRGSTTQMTYWIDAVTGRPVVAQSVATFGQRLPIVQATRYERWNDPALASLVPTITRAPQPVSPAPVRLTVSVSPQTVTSGDTATITVVGGQPHTYCGLTVLYADHHVWGGSGYVGIARADGTGTASWRWTPHVPRDEIATGFARCFVGRSYGDGQLSFTVVLPH